MQVDHLPSAPPGSTAVSSQPAQPAGTSSAVQDATNIALVDLHANKRKRESHSTGHAAPLSQATQWDILALLESRDGSSSFLQHVITNSNEQSQKRTKIDSGDRDDRNTASPSMASKLKSASYTTFSQISADASRVRDELSAAIRAKTEDDPLLAGRLPVDDLKHINRIQAMETLIKTLVEQELQYARSREEKNTMSNKEASQNSTIQQQGTGTVLTLFGGSAPAHRHLFSSTQIPINNKSSNIKLELSADELSLPSGILATKLMSGPSEDAKKRTFEDAFAPPFKLAELPLPKASKRPQTRGNTLTWEFKDPVQRNKKGGYTVQGLTVGDWVAYGGVDSGASLSSPREKRKQRERALSSSDGIRPPPSPVEAEEARAKEIDALFVRAYSSFAPVRDNTASLVSGESKNMVWWQKVGDRRFNDTFALDPALDHDAATVERQDTMAITDGPIADAEAFEKIVEELEGYEEPPRSTPAKSKTDVDAILGEISSLLETLDSYRQIRSTALPSSTSASRTPISPSPILASGSGKSDEPSDAEFEVYQDLRREIAYLILQLPPFAVAKLDGDQLADLGVSRLISIESKDIRGTMEEDRVSRQAKLAAMTTASTIANLTNRPSSSAGQHYNSTAQRTPAIGSAANTRYGQQYAARSPAPPPQYQRSTSSQQTTYGTPSATGSMAAWRNTPARPPQNSYAQPNGQQYYQQQRPPQQSPASYSGYKPTYQPPQASQAAGNRPAPYASPLPAHHQQYPASRTSNMAAANAVGYLNRSASPAKPPVTSYAPQTAAMQPRSQYPQTLQPQQQAISRGATPINYPNAQPHTPVNGHQPTPPPPRSQVSIASRPPSAAPLTAQAPPPPVANMGQSGQVQQTNGHA